MKKVCFLLVGHLAIVHIAWSQATFNMPGIRIQYPGYEVFTGDFSDPYGNYLFMFSSGSYPNQGSAWVIKVSPDGTDTLMREFSLDDTVTSLYTGFYTPQHTYLFLGQIREDTSAVFSGFCYLWALETDTLLNVISSKRYAVSDDYNAISKMLGHSLSHGKFNVIGLLSSSPANWYSDDLFFIQFDSLGDTLQYQVIKDSLHEKLYLSMLNPGGAEFVAVVFGWDVNFQFERIVVDSNLTFNDYPFPIDLEAPISMAWLTDTVVIAVGEKYQMPWYYWDIHVTVSGLSGISYYDMYLGNASGWDVPGLTQGVVRTPDACFIGGVLGTNTNQAIDTIFLCKLDGNYNVTWTQYYVGSVNYLINSVFYTQDKKILVTGSYFDPAHPSLSRNLIIFTIDEDISSGNHDGVNEDSLGDYTLFPNPGQGDLYIRSGNSLSFNVRILDINGKEVARKVAFNHEGCLDADHLKPGAYFIEIENDKQQRIMKKWCKGI